MKNVVFIHIAILNLLARFISPTIHHVFREGNMAADWIAKLGVLCKKDITFPHFPSPELTCILHDDYLGRTLERRAI